MKKKKYLIILLCICLLSCEKEKDNFDYKNVNYPEGAIKGVFSVSETKKVVFSQGNLQYQSSTGTWRFAEHQYDLVGIGYGQIDSTFYNYVGGTVLYSDNKKDTGWQDLFGWGTGNKPISKSKYDEDYITFVDWGVNKISNGGNLGNAWYTLSKYGWQYLLYERSNADSKLGLACVNGINGWVLLPDNWTLPNGVHFTPGFGFLYDDYDVNMYSISKWKIMESAGAVFLPAAGERYGWDVRRVGCYGHYWSSTENDWNCAYMLRIDDFSWSTAESVSRCSGLSVRLVQEVK